MPPIPIGRTILAKGSFTQIGFVTGVSRFDLERRLGFNAGHLAQGWSLAVPLQPPGFDQWTFRRYTDHDPYLPQDDPDAEPVPDTRTSEELLRDNGHDIDALKADVMRHEFAVMGSKRLAKVIPAINPEGWHAYPERAGAPQWLLQGHFAMSVVAFIGPTETYTGETA